MFLYSIVSNVLSMTSLVGLAVAGCESFHGVSISSVPVMDSTVFIFAFGQLFDPGNTMNINLLMNVSRHYMIYGIGSY